MSYVPWCELILAASGPDRPAEQPAELQDSERVASFHTSVLLLPFFFDWRRSKISTRGKTVITQIYPIFDR